MLKYSIHYRWRSLNRQVIINYSNLNLDISIEINSGFLIWSSHYLFSARMRNFAAGKNIKNFQIPDKNQGKYFININYHRYPYKNILIFNYPYYSTEVLMYIVYQNLITSV